VKLGTSLASFSLPDNHYLTTVIMQCWRTNELAYVQFPLLSQVLLWSHQISGSQSVLCRSQGICGYVSVLAAL